ncbi:hypothetical protein EV121DRAFT_296904 [Schizophyllum commune]
MTGQHGRPLHLELSAAALDGEGQSRSPRTGQRGRPLRLELSATALERRPMSPLGCAAPQRMRNSRTRVDMDAEDFSGALEEIEDGSADWSVANGSDRVDADAYSRALGIRTIPQRNGVLKQVKTAQGNDLRWYIRSTLAKLMALGKGATPTSDHYPTAAEVMFFASDKTFVRGPRRVHPVRVDIGRSTNCKMVDSEWNQEVALMTYQKLCATYVQLNRPRPPYSVFLPMFQARLRSLRALVVRARRNKKAGRVIVGRETTLNRMRDEHVRRGQGLYMNTDIEGVSKIYEMYISLPKEVVSPDQPSFPSTTDPYFPYTERKGPYEVRVPHWRNPDEELWFRIGALLQMASHFSHDSLPLKGNLPRVRIRTGRVVDYDIPAPPGLPRNFYDQTWLRKLELSNRDEDTQTFLDQVADVYDTTLPGELIRQVDVAVSPRCRTI